MTHFSSIEEIVAKVKAKAIHLTLRLIFKDISPCSKLVIFVPKDIMTTTACHSFE